MDARTGYVAYYLYHHMLAEKERHKFMSQYRICTLNLQIKLKLTDFLQMYLLLITSVYQSCNKRKDLQSAKSIILPSDSGSGNRTDQVEELTND